MDAVATPPTPTDELLAAQLMQPRGSLGDAAVLTDKKKLKFRECFPDQTAQAELLGVNACHYDNVPGTLFVTKRSILFNGSILIRRAKLEIDLTNVRAVAKSKFGLINNAISVATADGKFKFYDLHHRETTFSTILAAWRNAVPNADQLQRIYEQGESGSTGSQNADDASSVTEFPLAEAQSDDSEETTTSDATTNTSGIAASTLLPSTSDVAPAGMPLAASAPNSDSLLLAVADEKPTRHRSSHGNGKGLYGTTSNGAASATMQDTETVAVRSKCVPPPLLRRRSSFDGATGRHLENTHASLRKSGTPKQHRPEPQTPKSTASSPDETAAPKTNKGEIMTSQQAVDIALNGEQRGGQVVLNEVLQGTVEQVAALLFENNDFFNRVHQRRGDKDIKIGAWNDSTRDVSFVMPVKIPMSNKTSTPCFETHRITRRDDSCVTLNQETRTPEVPFGDYFVSCCRYVVTAASATTARIVVSGLIKFLKSTMFKGKIETNAYEGMRVFYADYKDEAQRFLKGANTGANSPTRRTSQGSAVEAPPTPAMTATTTSVETPTSTTTTTETTVLGLSTDSFFGVPWPIVGMMQLVLILLLILLLIFWRSSSPTLPAGMVEEYAMLRRSIELERTLLERTYLRGVSVGDMAQQLHDLRETVAQLAQQVAAGSGGSRAPASQP